jgi:sec-independent protein translocase protein TatA
MLPTVGPFELLLVLILALLLLGPGKLPEVGQALGKTIREFRRASLDVDGALKTDQPSPAQPTPAQPTPAQPAVTVSDERRPEPLPAETRSEVRPTDEPVDSLEREESRAPGR